MCSGVSNETNICNFIRFCKCFATEFSHDELGYVSFWHEFIGLPFHLPFDSWRNCELSSHRLYVVQKFVHMAAVTPVGCHLNNVNKNRRWFQIHFEAKNKNLSHQIINVWPILQIGHHSFIKIFQFLFFLLLCRLFYPCQHSILIYKCFIVRRIISCYRIRTNRLFFLLTFLCLDLVWAFFCFYMYSYSSEPLYYLFMAVFKVFFF